LSTPELTNPLTFRSLKLQLTGTASDLDGTTSPMSGQNYQTRGNNDECEYLHPVADQHFTGTYSFQLP